MSLPLRPSGARRAHEGRESNVERDIWQRLCPLVYASSQYPANPQGSRKTSPLNLRAFLRIHASAPHYTNSEIPEGRKMTTFISTSILTHRSGRSRWFTWNSKRKTPSKVHHLHFSTSTLILCPDKTFVSPTKSHQLLVAMFLSKTQIMSYTYRFFLSIEDRREGVKERGKEAIS